MSEQKVFLRPLIITFDGSCGNVRQNFFHGEICGPFSTALVISELQVSACLCQTICLPNKSICKVTRSNSMCRQRKQADWLRKRNKTRLEPWAVGNWPEIDGKSAEFTMHRSLLNGRASESLAFIINLKIFLCSASKKHFVSKSTANSLNNPERNYPMCSRKTSWLGLCIMIQKANNDKGLWWMQMQETFQAI